MKKNTHGNTTNLARRRFIVGSAAAAGGGLALGFHLPFGMAAAEAREATAGAGAEINTWVVVKADDTCVIRIARS
jgi:isoquinoline 1-oxidoreductase beta subunit